MEIGAVEWFSVMFGVVEGIGGLLLILITVWLASFRNGFAWHSDPKAQFNWHPLLMTLGMIFMYGNAILIYRAFRSGRKRSLKIAHAVINGVAFIFSVIGLQAAFDSHNLASPPIPNMYSLHSWLGLGAVILFTGQWVVGLIFFLYPTVNAPLRASYYPIHVFVGIGAFTFACATALLGLTEKAIFSVSDYSSLPQEGLLINFMGLIIVVFASLVIYLVSEPKYKRQPLPEDEMLLTSTDKVKNISPGKSSVGYHKPEAPPIVSPPHHYQYYHHHHHQHSQHRCVTVNRHQIESAKLNSQVFKPSQHNPIELSSVELNTVQLNPSELNSDKFKTAQIIPPDLQSCELVLEYYGEEEETLKIKIGHRHDRARKCLNGA